MEITPRTKIQELLKERPFLKDFLVAYNSKFEMLRNPVARSTLGKFASLQTAAGMAGIQIETLIDAIADEVEKQTGERPGTEYGGASRDSRQEERLKILKDIITYLHEGGDLGEARRRFAEAVHDVGASEIAAMEEELIRNGLPVSEVQRLCDVHVGAFRQALDRHSEVEAPPGHPVHTYIEDNKTITKLANELGALARDAERGDDQAAKLEQALPIIEELGKGMQNHYERKENQLFPVLERHDVTGPSQVMWGVHDQIRSGLKAVHDAVKARDRERFVAETPGFVKDLIEMVYKEEKILFPMALERLGEVEWAEIRRGEDELGYVLAKPSAEWPGDSMPCAEPESMEGGLLKLMTGELSLEQLNLVLTNLPVDLSFVDEHDTVRFYSEGPERIFPRSPAVIGRKVQNCHPPKSVHIVQEILDSFRSGKQSVAGFWIQAEERFIHIRYFAVRDKAGAYRGCLEVSQDVTDIRTLEGENRLLAWRNV